MLSAIKINKALSCCAFADLVTCKFYCSEITSVSFAEPLIAGLLPLVTTHNNGSAGKYFLHCNPHSPLLSHNGFARGTALRRELMKTARLIIAIADAIEKHNLQN